MATLSDLLENFIGELMEDDGALEIQRNELAEQFRCAPSQINYVLATRFTLQRGYVVESRRGGGGYIRISRIRLQDRGLIPYLLEHIGSSIPEHVALDRLRAEEYLGAEGAAVLTAALSDKAIQLPREAADTVRAGILRQVLEKMMIASTKEA